MTVMAQTILSIKSDATRKNNADSASSSEERAADLMPPTQITIAPTSLWNSKIKRLLPDVNTKLQRERLSTSPEQPYP
jgi:hypothetical protein